MESQTQISASDKPESENEGIELQVRISSDTPPPETDGSTAEHLQEVNSMSDEVGCTLKNEEDIPSTETGNVITELKSESGQDEPRSFPNEEADSLCLSSESDNVHAEIKSEAVKEESNYVSVEKPDLCPSVELSNTTTYEEKSDTILVDFGDTSQEKTVVQVISTTALTEEEKIKTTSNESNLLTSSESDKDLNHTNKLSSFDQLTQQSSDSGNVLKFTVKESETYNPGKKGGVLRVDSLKSLCLKQNEAECGNLAVNTNSKAEKSETQGDRETISHDKPETSTRFSENPDNESATIDNSAIGVKTSVFKSNNGAADATENANEEKVTNEQSKTPFETVCEESIVCKNSGNITKIDSGKNVDDKNSAGFLETAGENSTKEDSNIAPKVEILHTKRDENITKEQLSAAESVVSETVSNETANMGPSETRPEATDEDSGRAFFYVSSSSIPGMGKEWEWPSVSSDHLNQRPPRRMERRRNTSESRTCLGTQRCHYIILAVGILGAILGCLTYHLQDYGIGPKVLRPIGASAAFLSFVVCAFSSVYLTYLSYYPHGRSSRNYQPLDLSNPVASMLVDTMPQGYNSDPRFYFTPSAAATFQQVFRETQSADALERRGYGSCQQTDIKRPYDEPGPSGYDPDLKRLKMDPTTTEAQSFEMKSIARIGEKDQTKERNYSQGSDGCHYTLADQVEHSNSSGESENGEKTPLLPKK